MENDKMEELKKVLKHSDRYKDFTILDNPVRFKDMADGRDIDVVQLHSIQILDMKGHKDIVGFCGQCAWKGNVLTSLDGDCYSDDMLVYGYAWFEHKEKGIIVGLDILVDEW